MTSSQQQNTIVRPSKRIQIFDTTLRDGQQCPGAGMSEEENYQYAELAANKLNVDILEAGFPTSQEIDFRIVNNIAASYAAKKSSPIVAALCQLREEQIGATIDSLDPAIRCGRARLHTYLPVDPGLMKASIKKHATDKNKLIDSVAKYVRQAVEAGIEVQFSPEGYSRMGTNFEFVTQLIRAAVGSGATVINCPDTKGAATPFEGPEYFVEKMRYHASVIAREFPSSQITWSVHCHNDLGLAVINSMNGVMYGPATQIEGTINGVGERAGNAALEQVVAQIIHLRESSDSNLPLLTTQINAQHIMELSHLISNKMLPQQPHSPIVGKNAFAHSSGGHTNAVLEDETVYTPIIPSVVGAKTKLFFTPQGGSNHAQQVIQEAGFVCGTEEKVTITQYIKKYYADRRKGITDEELIVAYKQYRAPIKIDQFSYTREQGKTTLKFSGDFFGTPVTGKELTGKTLLQCFTKEIQNHIPSLELRDYKDVTTGETVQALAKSEVSVFIPGNSVYSATALHDDTQVATFEALIKAVNLLYVDLKYRA